MKRLHKYSTRRVRIEPAVGREVIAGLDYDTQSVRVCVLRRNVEGFRLSSAPLSVSDAKALATEILEVVAGCERAASDPARNGMRWPEQD